MSKNDAIGSRILLRVCFAILIVVSGLASCGGGGAGSANQSVSITVAPPVITAFADAGGGNVKVTSANSLSNGTIITISGTTHYNGTYTVANVTATSFTIVATSAGNDATGTWQLAGGLIAGCSTSGATSAITPSNVPSRFQGVAPLSVFFDASATTATATTKPFHDLEYRWSFGENLVTLAALPGGANWTNGSTKGSRNTATGPVAAHVFETPGAYTIALTVTDGTNTVSNSCVQIAVQDPNTVFSGTNTICFSTSGTFAACPAGATHVTTADFASAINTYQATGKRLLFRRTETFTAASSSSITKTGPGIIGTFDTGAAPTVQTTGGGDVLLISSATTPGISDWRVMDLTFSGGGANLVRAYGGFNQFLALRLNSIDMQVGVEAGEFYLDWWNTNGNPGHTVLKEWAVVDSSFNATAANTFNSAWRVYLIGEKNAIMGNFMDNVGTGQHVVRSSYLNKGVINNNTLARPGSTQHALKLHGPTWCDTTVSTCNYLTDPLPTSVTGSNGGYTDMVVISDNKFIGAANAWTTALGPQNAQSDERVRGLIVERNWFVAGSGTNVAIISNAADSTFRNNICDMTGAAYHNCISVERRGVEPPPVAVRIYNNTFYSNSSGDFIGVNITSAASNVSVINNLGSAPSANNGPVMISGTGASGLVDLNNILNNSPAALFVTTSPVNPVDFSLKALPNPARDTGSTIPVLSDFFRTARPQNGVIDIGAVEGP
jgi:hypothetical protein